MRRSSIIAGIVFCLLIVTMAAPTSALDIKGLKNQAFTDLEGNKKTLGDYQGKVVLLNFWASWCSPCLMEIPGLNRVYERYQSRGFEILGLSLDSGYSLTKIKDLSTRHRIRYKVGKAEAGMVNELNIMAIPVSYLFDKNGKMIQQFMGQPNHEALTKAIEAALSSELAQNVE